MDAHSVRTALALSQGLMLIGCAAPAPKPSADDLRAAKQHQMAPLTPEVEATRQKLLSEYRALVTNLYPTYNGIQVEFRPNVYGAEYGFFYASHRFLLNTNWRVDQSVQPSSNGLRITVQIS